MSLTAAAIRLMASKGMTAEDIADIAEAMEKPVPELSLGALRTRKWRERLDATGMAAEDWRVLSSKIIARDGGRCQYCGTTKGRMACDHVVPLVQGGSSDENNLVCACHACNGGKSGQTLEQWRGSEWTAQWRYHRETSRDISHVGERTQVEVSSSSSLRSEEIVVGGVGNAGAIPPSDDWPAGKADDHAKLLIATVASPWLDPNKSPDLVTTRGRVAAWKRDGASWEHDVLPIVTGLCANRRAKIGTWKFFDAAIARSIAENRAALEIPHAQPRSTGPPRTFDEKSRAAWDEAERRLAQNE